jgi:hypothetical protein
MDIHDHQVNAAAAQTEWQRIARAEHLRREALRAKQGIPAFGRSFTDAMAHVAARYFPAASARRREA